MILRKSTVQITVIVIVIIITVSQIVFANKPSQNSLLPEKTVLSALMKNADVLLKDAAFCEGVGTDENDRSIGDYLSGFWSFHSSKQGKNWIEVSSSQLAKGVYLSKVMIYRKDGEENWGWGVSFKLDSHKKVVRDSFTCLGAG